MTKDFMILPIEIKSIDTKTDDNMEYYVVEGYASVYNNIDQAGDRVLANFFDEDLRKNGNERTALWQHNWNEPVGTKLYSSDAHGLKFCAKLPKADSFVSGRVYPQLKAGAVTGVSIGYRVQESNYNRSDECCDLVKGQLLESSFVTFPCNREARITSVSKSIQDIRKNKTKSKYAEYKDFLSPFVEKLESFPTTHVTKSHSEFFDLPFMDEGTKWSPKDALKNLKQLTKSEQEPTRDYRQGFLVYDEEKTESFDSYKLPFATVENGIIKAVPARLYATAAALAGNKKTMHLSDDEIEKAKFQINKYYEKLDRVPPFKGNTTFIDNNTIKYFKDRDFEKLFEQDNDIILSKAAKNFVVGCILKGLSRKAEEMKNTGDGEHNDLQQSLKQLHELYNTHN